MVNVFLLLHFLNCMKYHKKSKNLNINRIKSIKEIVFHKEYINMYKTPLVTKTTE